MQQTVKGKKIGTLMGVVLVLGIVAALVALSIICSVVEYYAGSTAGVILFWACGAMLAWVVMRFVVMGYVYTYNGMVMRIERSYGKKTRFVEDVSVRHLNGIGTLEEMKAKFPHGTVVRATVRKCPIPQLAVAYTNAEGQRIAVIQPDEEMRAKLYENLKK